MKQFTATANDDGVRLSRFVQSVTRDFPTSLLYKSFRNKRVKVNGKKAAPEYRLQAGDLIELYINDEFFPPEGAKPAQKAAPKKQPNQPKVTVIYEDENLAVLYKPTHLLCHSDRTGDANLVDAFTQSRFFGASAGAFLLFARFENPVKKAFLPAFDSQPVGFRDRNLHKKNREFY